MCSCLKFHWSSVGPTLRSWKKRPPKEHLALHVTWSHYAITNIGILWKQIVVWTNIDKSDLFFNCERRPMSSGAVVNQILLKFEWYYRSGSTWRPCRTQNQARLFNSKTHASFLEWFTSHIRHKSRRIFRWNDTLCTSQLVVALGLQSLDQSPLDRCCFPRMPRWLSCSVSFESSNYSRSIFQVKCEAGADAIRWSVIALST